MSALKRVGHKGADLIAPGNTPASFDAAVAAGVDMIEFDVLPEVLEDPAGSRLVLAHDYSHDLADAPTLDEGLAHLAGLPFEGVELDVDLKVPGYEDRVVAALQAHGLVERTLVSSMYVESLDRVRALEPRLRVGWSIPKAHKDYTASAAWKLPAAAAILVGRPLVARRAAAAIRRGRFDAVMVFHALVTARLATAVRRAGGELYVWTVDDAVDIRRFEAMGVTGVITNDPRLFVT
jgi:glycerophosphoryl diester phosphodiesterase